MSGLSDLSALCDPRSFSSGCKVNVDKCGRKAILCPRGSGAFLYDTVCEETGYRSPCGEAQKFDPFFLAQNSCPPQFDITGFAIQKSMANQGVNLENTCGKTQIIFDACGRPQYNHRTSQQGSGPFRDIFAQHPLWGNPICEDKLPSTSKKCGKPFMTDTSAMNMIDRYAFLSSILLYIDSIKNKVANKKALNSVFKIVSSQRKKIFPAALRGVTEYGEKLPQCFDLRGYKNSIAFGSDAPFEVSWVVNSVSSASPTLTPVDAADRLINAALNYKKWSPVAVIPEKPNPSRPGIEGVGVGDLGTNFNPNFGGIATPAIKKALIGAVAGLLVGLAIKKPVVGVGVGVGLGIATSFVRGWK